MGVVTVWIITCVLWSGTFLFIKLGLRDIPPLTFAWVRLAIAACVLVPIAWRSGEWRTLPRRDLWGIAAAGVLLLGVNYALIFWGTQFIPSGLVAILIAGNPMLALLFGWMFGSERVTLPKVVAVAGGIVGVALIFGAEARASGASALLGAAAVFASSVCVSFAYVWLKTFGGHVSRTTVTALQLVAGFVPLFVAGMWLEGVPAAAAWPVSAWTSLLYLALGASVAAFWLNYWLLQRMDTSAVLMMGVAEVPIAIALGAAVFGERLPAGTLAGAALIVAGVGAVLYLGRRR